MSLPVETMEELLRIATRGIAELRARADLTPVQMVRAESEIEARVRTAMAGDAAAIAWCAAPIEMPAPEAAELAWLAGATEASAPTTAGPASAPGRRGKSAPEPEIPGITKATTPKVRNANLPRNRPDGLLEFASKFIDRRRESYLCEAVDEAPNKDIGESFFRASHDNFRTSVEHFINLAGNRPPRSYTHAELARVPPKRPRRLTLRQAIADADADADADQRERAEIVEAKGSGASPGAIQAAIEAAAKPRLKWRMVDRVRGNLGTVFAWLVLTGVVPENPFNGACTPRRAKAAIIAADEPTERRPWTPAEQRTLFAARPDDPVFYWAPRLSLGTGGGRLEEVLSRRGKDFRDAGDGGWLVRYPPKTSLSPWRDVPVHSALFDEGLLELILAAGDGFMFDQLPIDKKGRRAGSMSRDFGRYCDAIGLRDPGLDFQGLRGTANRFMEAVGADGSPGATLTTREAVLGHRSKALADTDYLRGGADWQGRRRAVERIALRAWCGPPA